jgi:hypothetical protein
MDRLNRLEFLAPPFASRQKAGKEKKLPAKTDCIKRKTTRKRAGNTAGARGEIIPTNSLFSIIVFLYLVHHR